MNMSGKIEALLDWVKTWEKLDDLIKLNSILTKEGDAALNVVYSNKDGKPYVDGTAQRKFTFALQMMLPWSDGHDPTNLEAEKLVTEWLDWVDAQYPTNIPDWDAEIDNIEALWDSPSINVFQDESIARYTFNAYITYTE